MQKSVLSVLAVTMLLSISSATFLTSLAHPELKQEQVILDVTTFLMGFASGLVDIKIDLTTCQFDQEALGKTFGHALGYFAEPTPPNIFEGVTQLAIAVAALPSIFSQCTTVLVGIQSVVNKVGSLSNPAVFLFNASKNMLFNGANIINTFGAAFSCNDKQDGYGFGYNIGKGIALISG